MTEKIEKTEKILKIYMPDGAELIYKSKDYDWNIFSTAITNSIMRIQIFSKDGKEMQTIEGYFAIKEIITKVEEEEKKI